MPAAVQYASNSYTMSSGAAIHIDAYLPLGSGPLLRREASSAGVGGVPKKRAFGELAAAPKMFYTKSISSPKR